LETMISNQQTKVEYDLSLEKVINQVVSATARLHDLGPDTELSILLVDDDYIRKLNHLYRGQDSPTDVLSFAMNESGEDEPEYDASEETNILGDIVISLEKALVQSQEYGHSLAREVGFLTVHGMLHLLGFEHSSEADDQTMQAWQEKILQSVDLER